MDKYTFGDSRAAVNLMTTLERSEYSPFARKVCSLLAKQLASTKAILAIPDETIRKAVLRMWHQSFVGKVNNAMMPDVLRSHTICVATKYFRNGIKGNRKA